MKLRWARLDDFDAVNQWIGSKEELEQWSGSGFKYPLSIKQWEDYLNEKDRHSFTAVWKDSPAGHISIGRIERCTTGRIGRVITSPEHRGKKIAGQMLREIITYAFDELELKTVTLGVFPFNTPAIQVYEKAGFSLKEPGRTKEITGGDRWNTLEMILHKSEWKN
ncbi:GNAT family N-acetyltransferase [Halobacillus halophilus]|uniref:GNAT family N-acetyltransferase n=1 Tax=Halobacillus halophilus TaxID=1570 RepID=UPI00136C8619|nr:GNAT family protein [Halobacillus halophilus]MYL30182.1 GNAT family N-acetyltransferase [Halobacillus halophilus]